MRLPRRKQCKLCYRYKIKKEHFRVTNRSRRRTSKVCRTCEALIGINKPDDTELIAGYMYVLFDSAHFDWIKIGCTTNLKNRLLSYNRKKPENTCDYVYTSQCLGDVFNVERILLKRLKLCVKTISGKNEWFPIKCKELLISEVKRAEDILNAMS